MVIVFQGIFLMHIVPHLSLSRTFILNFVHHHFLSKLLQRVQVLIVIHIINLINCDASQSTNVLTIIFFQWATWLAYHQKHYEIAPSPSRIHILYIAFIFTFRLTVLYTTKNKFTQFYIYTYRVLHLHLHEHKCRRILDTYMKCK